MTNKLTVQMTSKIINFHFPSMYSAILPKMVTCNSKFIRKFCTPAPKKFKVAVCGAAGGIGQPLSLLLKFNALISELSLYDIKNVKGIATDLSHIETATKVKGYMGPENLNSALENSALILITAGVAQSPGMARADLFNYNAKIVKNLMENVAKVAPNALVAIITNPVNSMVPVACEVLKKANKFDPRKVFGISTLDIVRANTFAAEIQKIDPKDVYVPVIGGHSSPTMVPLLSKTTPTLSFTDEQIKALTTRIQDAGTEVVNAKEGSGSATLSMAYAAGRFASSALRALNGADNIIEIAYIHSDIAGTQYFGHPFVLGKQGIEKHLRMANLSDYESNLLDEAVEHIKSDIDTGINYAKAGDKSDKKLNL